MRPLALVSSLVVVLAGCASLEPSPPKMAPAAEPMTTGTPARNARVRVRFAPNGARGASALQGRLVTLRGDTLVMLESDPTRPADTIVLGESRRLEVLSHSRGHGGIGALAGAFGGGMLGAIIGSATYQPCSSTEFLGCLMYPSAGETAIGYGFLGAAAGAALGVIIGSSIRTETWSPVAVPQVQAGRGAGATIGLHFAF